MRLVLKQGAGRRAAAMLAAALCHIRGVACQYPCVTDSDCNYVECTNLISSYDNSGSCNCNARACNCGNCNPYNCNPYSCSPYNCNPHNCNGHNCNCVLWFCSTCYDTCYDTCYNTCYHYCYNTCCGTCYDTCSCSFTCSNAATCSAGVCSTSSYGITSGSACCGASCAGGGATCPPPPLCPNGTWSVDGYDGASAGRQCDACPPGTYANATGASLGVQVAQVYGGRG